LYHMKDHFVDFWFRFVYPFKQELERGNMRGILDQAEKLEEFFSFPFEHFILEAIPYFNLGSFTSIGKWWYRDIEIDGVAIDDITRTILFIECKWQEDVDRMAIIQQLEQKSAQIPWLEKYPQKIYLVCAKSFRKIPPGKKSLSSQNPSVLNNSYFFDLAEIELRLRSYLIEQKI
jgi:AAA+ ATPase superfamily predicted ATPase